MNRKLVETYVGKYFIYAVACVSMVVAPRVILDPINPPKMLLLFIFSTAGVFLMLPHLGFYFKGKTKVLLVFTGIYVLNLLFILTFSGANFGQQIFGTFGRNNGFLTYLGLMFVFLLGALTSSDSSIKRFLLGLIFVSMVSGAYGILQSMKIDPAGFVSLYSPAIGFLGNPDFFSAFHGLALIASLAMAVVAGEKGKLRYLFMVSTLLNIYALKIAGAKQGVLVAVIGIAFVMVIVGYQRSKVIGYVLTSIGFVGLNLVALGLINSGPLASIIYKSSLEARGYYWGAAWRMTVDNPILGIGLDNFGSWYRRARSLEAYQWLPTQETNAAHNVYLDFSSNGGFPFLLLNLILVALILYSFLAVVRRDKKLNPYYIIGFSIWVAFQAQLLISINQIGNAVWGWALGGILLGYSYLSNDQSIKDKNETNSKKQKVRESEMLPAPDLLRFTGGVVLAIVVVFPYWKSAVSFQNALESQSIERIKQAAVVEPYDLVRLIGTSRVLNENGLVEEAKAVLKIAVETFPDSYVAWEALSKLPDTSEVRMKEIKSELLRLDPRVTPGP